MKKILYFFTILLFLPLFFLKINAMESPTDDSSRIIKGILSLAYDKSRNLRNTSEPYFYTLRNLFDLNIQTIAKAYEYLVPNLFKEELDKYLKEFIKNKIINKEFDEWLKQFEIGQFRKKIIEETIKILIHVIKFHINKQTDANLINFINAYPNTSIIRTIVNVFYYQITTNDFLIPDYSSTYFMNSKIKNHVSYALMFSPTFNLPLYLLEHLLELAPYLYDPKPINILYLNSNQLKNIPETIGCISDLQEIYLENNNLKHLPQSILNLPKLQKIKIDRELFKQLPLDYINCLNTKKIKIEFD